MSHFIAGSLAPGPLAHMPKRIDDNSDNITIIPLPKRGHGLRHTYFIVPGFLSDFKIFINGIGLRVCFQLEN